MLNKSKTILITLVVYFLLLSNLSANGVDKKNILLLHSYHAGMTWIENINKAVNDTLQSKSNNYVIYTEYMDTKRHSSQKYYEILKELYSKKYKNIKFDIILSSDNNAFDFLVKNRNDIFGKIPVSFCGVNGFNKSMLSNVELFTGVAEQFSDKDTINTILKLHPNIKNLYIINDYLATGKAWQNDMKKNLKEYEKKINIIYSKNLSLVDLKNKINSFSSDTAILLGVYFADQNKEYITYEKIGSYLVNQSKAPVYCLLNFNISNNIIGGKVIGGYSQGKAMSKVALRILNSEKPKDIKIRFAETNKYIFNYDGIVKYNINQNLLPKNSTIINKPFYLYEEYKSILFDLIYLFLSIFILFIIFILYIKYKNNNSQLKKDYFIISVIRFSPFFIIPIVTVSIVWLLIHNSNKSHEELKKVEKLNYIENMKKESKREVDRYIQLVQSRVKISKNQTEVINIRNNVLNLSRNIKYGKSGYLIIGSLKGIMLSHPNKKLEGSNLFDGKHKKTKDIFIKFKNKIDTEGSGFVEYNWINPYSKIEEKKLTYVNYLPEFDWYVASGVYLDEVNRYIGNKIKKDTQLKENNIDILIVVSLILLLFSFILSYILSTIIKNSFSNYRKNLLEQIEKSKIIEKSKKEFETIFKYAQDGIVITDEKANFIKYNDAFKKIIGFNNSELSNKSYYDIIDSKDKEEDFKIINQALRNGHVENFKKECITKDKIKILVHISISLLPDKKTLLFIIKDASSIKLLEEQSKLAAMGEMIGNIAHQWRQPLSVISTGATGLILKKEFNTLEDDYLIKTCKTINENSQYLSKTIDDFRNFIKGDREIVEFYLIDNINSFLHLVEGSMKNHNIELINNVDKNIKIKSYPNELIQCFINIFNNSKDVLKNKSYNRYIFLKTSTKDNKVCISIKDNAGGIPNDVLPHIFEPYFTTKHKSQGTGLGLSMTYNIITDGMNGSIEASNVSYNYKDKNYTGAEFKIVLFQNSIEKPIKNKGISG